MANKMKEVYCKNCWYHEKSSISSIHRCSHPKNIAGSLITREVIDPVKGKYIKVTDIRYSPRCTVVNADCSCVYFSIFPNWLIKNVFNFLKNKLTLLHIYCKNTIEAKNEKRRTK